MQKIIAYVLLHGRPWAYGEDGGDAENGPDYSGIEFGVRLGPLFTDPEGKTLVVRRPGYFKEFDSTGKDITNAPPY